MKCYGHPRIMDLSV